MRTRNQYRPMKRQQHGYMLVGTLFAMAVVAASLTVYAKHEARQILYLRAQAEGQSLSQYAVGLRGFIAATQATPGPAPAPQVGVAWLRPPTCGGLATNPVEGFVPCSYTGGTFGALFNTTFTRNPVTNFIEARTSFVVPAQGDTALNSILLAEQVVQSALANQTLPANGVFFNAFANVPVTANAPAPAAAAPGGDAGRVVMVANNAPSNDIFLRTDGTNQMLANLNMGGFSIGNARDARFNGDVRIDRRLQVDQGATIQGPADLRGGAVTNEIALTSINHFVTEGIYDARVYTGAASYTIPKPNCAAAGNNPGIYVALQGTGTINGDGTYRADSMYEARADVTNAGASWVVTPVMRGTRFDLTVDSATGDLVFDKTVATTTPADMRLLIMTRCR